MKFSKYLCTFILFYLILFIPIPALAAEDLWISDWFIDSTIKENGDLEIVEDITFVFNDDFNGVFREIVLNETRGVEGIQVSEVTNGNLFDYTQADDAKEGQNGIYQVAENDEKLIVQIFSPSKDEEKTFRIKYKVKDVSVKYNDTGELYYQFLGEENSTPIKSFTVNIRLPQNINDTVKIFAHGPHNGMINFKGNNAVRAEVREVPEDTFVEVRVLFPVAFIPNSLNIVNEDAYESIVQEEMSYIEKLEAKRIQREKGKAFLNEIIPFITGFGVISLGFIIFKFRRKKDYLESLDNKTYPDPEPPAIVAQLVTGVISDTTIMATLYDLARRGFLSIGNIGENQKETDNFRMKKSNKSVHSLLRHEKFLLEWLFHTIGDGEIVETKDIGKYSEKKVTEFHKDYSQWIKIVQEETKAKGYYDDNSKSTGTLLLITSIVIVIITIVVTAYFEAYAAFLLLFTGIVGIIYAIVLLTRKSDYGYIQMMKWIEFKKDLKQRSESPITHNFSLSLDKSLIYGLALGLDVDTLKSFQPLASESYMSNYWMYWLFFSNRSGDNAFQKSLTHSFNNGSTSMGAGGNFSAGGGGGAGGGGAGGF